MGCEYYRELISAEADGEVTEAERAALRAHLAACEDCRRYAAALKAIGEGLGEEAEVPAGFAESVMAKLPAKKNVIPLRRWGSLAAAAVLVIALSGVAGRVFAPKGGAAVPAAGADMAAPAAAAPAMPEAEEQKNEAMMFAAPRMADAPAEEAPAEFAVMESAADAVAADPREEAALGYAREKRPGHWEVLRVENETVTLRHESGEELTLTVDENGEVSE